MPSSAAPPRPDAAAATVRRERRWLPAVAVAATIVAVVLGGYVTAGALSTGESSARTVAGAVTVRPENGWLFVQDLGASAEGGARFTRGSGSFDVFVGSASADATAVAQAYVSESLEPASSRLTISPGLHAVPLDGGIMGARFSYIGSFDQSGVPIEGEVTVAVSSSGAGVVFDGWGPQGQLRFVLDDVHAMIEGATFP